MKSPTPITADLMGRFLEECLKSLEGDWAVIGGTLLPLLGIDLRVTVDIDFISLTEKKQQLQVMEIAERLGLPVEAINSAGEYFLSKIPDFRDHLVVHRENSQCRILRPDVTLFLLLKLGRLSEEDARDCHTILEQLPKLPDRLDKKRILKRIEGLLEEKPSREKKKRLLSLQNAIA